MSFSLTNNEVIQNYASSNSKQIQSTFDYENASKRYINIDDIRIQAYASKGGRHYQEDRAVFIKDFNQMIPNSDKSTTRSFFAVFDGHGGSIVSQELSNKFALHLANHSMVLTHPIDALQEVWKEMDSTIYKRCQKYADDMKSMGGTGEFPTDGSTAVIGFLVHQEFYVMNCGDSHCYYFDNEGIGSRLTEDHSTRNPEEVSRCLKAGGLIHGKKGCKFLPFPLCLIPYNYGYNKKTRRIYPGGLEVTRSFGDFDAKKEELGGREGVILSHHGKIAVLKLSNVKYIVLGSDGIWDPLEPTIVYRIISQRLRASRREDNSEDLNKNTGILGNTIRDLDIGGDRANNAERLCKSAVNSCYWWEQRTHADNATAIIVELSHSQVDI